AYVRKQDLMRAGDRVGIALSGGADSVALLRLMLELRQEVSVVLSVIHLNHKLRGAESDADEAFVRELAQKHGLELICDSRDVTVRATEYKLSLEAAGRAFRYEFFRSALEGGLNRIATAHTLDDQAETLLLKLARRHTRLHDDRDLSACCPAKAGSAGCGIAGFDVGVPPRGRSVGA